MAYRRRHRTLRASTFEDFSSSFNARCDDSPASTPTSLAAQAIRASSAHRDSSILSSNGDLLRQSSVFFNQKPVHHDHSSLQSKNERGANESKYGFWSVLASKAKSILEDDGVSQQFNDLSQFNQPILPPVNTRKPENLASSINQIGGTIKSALEEGLTIVENRASEIIQETKKIQIRRKTAGLNSRDQVAYFAATENLSQNLSDQENQLKASQNQANSMAAKAKLLLRELKTVKADLAFAKERCDQLVEENKLLRESRQKGDNTEDDDLLIRLQLETLLAEKGRLAHEIAVYARENRFLREIVEYQSLTMQNVGHLDDSVEYIVDNGATHISSSFSSSHSASEVISLATSSPRTQPNSPNSSNANVDQELRSGPTRENVNEVSPNSSPKSEETPRMKLCSSHLELKFERAD